MAVLGFRVTDSGPHTSKTLMLQELEALLMPVRAKPLVKVYQARGEAANEQGFFNTCDETATQSSQAIAREECLQALQGEL